MNWVYIKSEPQLWTVGFYLPSGKFEPESDHRTPDQAAERVHYLNGGSKQPTEAEIRSALDFGKTAEQHVR